MALLPPPPVQDQAGSYAWLDWYRLLRNYISQTGSIPWSVIDFTGSDIVNIITRSHQSLQNLLGGTTNEYYHLTAAQYTALGQSTATQSVAIDTSLSDTYSTTVVTASGKTITLPAASTARIGRSWIVILGTTGYTNITRAGSDTITLPTSDNTIRLNNKGASVTLRCTTATSWSIV